MNLAWQYRKFYVFAFFLLAALLALGYRLVELQAVEHGHFQALAAANTVRTIAREPMRGRIVDIHGNPLATSVPAKIICANPSFLGNQRAAVAHALAPLLETNEAWLFEKLAPRLVVNEGKTNITQYTMLKAKVPLETWDKIRDTMATLNFGVNEAKLKGEQRAFYRGLHTAAIFAREDQVRTYPNHALAAHVLGFVTGDGAEEAGMDGIERTFNTKLSGVRGWKKTELDKRQRERVEFRNEDIEADDGLNVVLTLDVGLQAIVEAEIGEAMRKLSPVSISSVIIRPRTGEILALASVPTYDPNHAGNYPITALRDRVIADCHEPGSTFKIVVVTGALDRQVVTLNQVFDCEHGHFSYAGSTLHDDEPHGLLAVENIITKSSNIGAAKIGIILGQNSLFQYIRNFGFGERTGIPLPAEACGIVHSLANWSKISIARIPMGQGIAVTPLQTVMAMCAIANHGVLMRPLLVDRLEDSTGATVVKYQPQAVRQVAGSVAISEMLTALKTVVTPDGTAVKANLEHYTVAGKTGTAEKVEGGRYAPGKYYSSFLGFFPADNPEICISVFIDEPPASDHFGGKVAAPIFKAIADRAANYLNLKPDIEPGTPVNQTLLVATGAHPEKNN